MGLTVETAANGQIAVDYLKEHSVDCILMDCQMPVMDGYDATKEIRLLEAGTAKRTPIIAMTANAMEGDKEKCFAAGMDDYLSKPVRRDDLERRLRHWLRSL